MLELSYCKHLMFEFQVDYREGDLQFNQLHKDLCFVGFIVWLQVATKKFTFECSIAWTVESEKSTQCIKMSCWFDL